MNTHHSKRFRRPQANPWSKHNLNLINAACTVTLRKHGLHVSGGFNLGQPRPKKEGK